MCYNSDSSVRWQHARCISIRVSFCQHGVLSLPFLTSLSSVIHYTMIQHTHTLISYIVQITLQCGLAKLVQNGKVCYTPAFICSKFGPKCQSVKRVSISTHTHSYIFIKPFFYLIYLHEKGYIDYISASSY